VQAVTESLETITQQRPIWTIEQEYNYDTRGSMAEIGRISVARQVFAAGA
jgi:hypothetical protein